ncbi:YciI family protein [Desertihabitans aurantiacus]|uniref:YciI family protein n=1 Tax=Desertihabitans aurantiacus TaxID=2282477 RepID=UPI000DF7F3B1|nr:YciI family protein [Desertihabitans aurantiacus]
MTEQSSSTQRFVVLITYTQGDEDAYTPEVHQRYVEGHRAFEQYVSTHGQVLSSAALADPDRATTVRRREGGVVTTEGPFAETVEMIGGYYDVELPDLDAAVEACALLPEEYTLEIRPTVRISM